VEHTNLFYLRCQRQVRSLNYTAWKKTQRHPIVIYADFEALLVKTNEKCSDKTTAYQKHEPMCYGFLVKADNDVPRELLEKFDIPTTPVIFRGSLQNQDVAKHFVDSIVEMAEKIDKLLKTNTPIVMTSEQRPTHVSKSICNLCECNFSTENHKVADH